MKEPFSGGKGLSESIEFENLFVGLYDVFLERLRNKITKVDEDLIDEDPEFQASGWAKMTTKGSGIEK